MKQQIKCPYCKKMFPIEDSLKHEAEEYRKKLQIEEKEKSSIKQKAIELNYKIKAEKQDKEHQAELDQLKEKGLTKQKKEAQKLAADQVKKFKEASEQESKNIKNESEIRAKKDQKEREALEEKLQKQEKAHQIDINRMRTKSEAAARAASQSPVERKGEIQEELIEEFLKKYFPMDQYEPVKKGKRGADVIQFVHHQQQEIGKILHESKDVLNFDEKWVGKLIDDMHREDAMIGIIFTKVMPKKSKGVMDVREGGRITICSDESVLQWVVSTSRKLIIQQNTLNKSTKEDVSSKLQQLHDYVVSNEFKLQYRKIRNNFQATSDQLEKDERSFEIQIKNRKKNLDESKKNIHGVITSLISNAGISDDLLE
jgi:hypothetical protein